MTEHECGEVGLALMEDAVEMPKMVSLKEQLTRNSIRRDIKRNKRLAKNPKINVLTINPGNKDRGIPYKGKDKFGGMLRKFEDRIERNAYSIKLDADTVYIHRLHYADNNKYNANGTLKN